VSSDNTAASGVTSELRPQTTGLTTLISIGVIALGIAIAFVVYSIHHRDLLSAQANSWARTFISSSPVVEEHLGHVQTVKEVTEKLPSGKATAWNLDYDVTGRSGTGVVEMRMKPGQYDQWSVQLAELDEGQRKPINLR
jgi:hypothetical protein